MSHVTSRKLCYFGHVRLPYDSIDSSVLVVQAQEDGEDRLVKQQHNVHWTVSLELVCHEQHETELGSKLQLSHPCSQSREANEMT